MNRRFAWQRPFRPVDQSIPPTWPRATVCAGRGSELGTGRTSRRPGRIPARGSWGWHRCWRRGPAAASVGRRMVMRGAMGYGGGGGPGGYGGRPMAGGGARRAGLRHAGFGPSGTGAPGFTLHHRLQGQFQLDVLPPGLHERAVLLALSVVRAFVGEPAVGSEEAPRRAGLRPPLKRPVRFSRMPLSHRCLIEGSRKEPTKSVVQASIRQSDLPTDGLRQRAVSLREGWPRTSGSSIQRTKRQAWLM